MLFQIQEMLLTEGGGEAQIDDELPTAYNPLIPQGSELVATIMFEIDDPLRREALLARLGGVEDCFFLRIGEDRVAARPEGDIERTREDGKASSVHFVHFPLELAPHRGVPRSEDRHHGRLRPCRLQPPGRPDPRRARRAQPGLRLRGRFSTEPPIGISPNRRPFVTWPAYTKPAHLSRNGRISWPSTTLRRR